MSEIEIYVREDPSENKQTPYINAEGAAYIIANESKGIFDFDKVFKEILHIEFQE